MEIITEIRFSRQRIATKMIKGFSLVEVALALAIAAFGILTVVSLMPASFNNVKSAGNAVTSSRIFQQMLGELQSMDWGTYSAGQPGWSKLNNLQAGQPTSRRFFDIEGTRIPEGDDDIDRKLVYVAEFYFPPVGVQVTGGVAAATGDVRRDMRHVVIRLMESPNPDYIFKEGGIHQERAFTVARPF